MYFSIATKTLVSAIAFLLFLIAWGCEHSPAKKGAGPENAAESDSSRISRIDTNEELVLNLTPRLSLIAEFLERREPTGFEEVFESPLEYLGPDVSDFHWEKVLQSAEPELVAHFHWPLAKEKTSAGPTQIWAPVLQTFNLLDGKFGVLAGQLTPSGERFEMITSFEARSQTNACVGGLKAKQKIVWKKAGNEWKIESWIQSSLEIILADQPFFENVTQQVFPHELAKQISRSKHEEFLIRRARNPNLMRYLPAKARFFADWNSLHSYPSTSVVDLDRDGWDDIFLTGRQGKCLFLRNRGDDTFEDLTEAVGLGLDPGYANCALFADFDNDGDSDLLLGRNFEPCLFFENRDGRFVPDETLNNTLKYATFVTSGAVVDINRDGLLDVYLSTYVSGELSNSEWVSHVVPPDLEQKFISTLYDSEPFVDRAGPPNLVLMNRDGKLELVETDSTTAQWRNSFQSVWTDVDADGDLDAYLCNDFAPDVLLCNETEPGSFVVKFVDKTEQFFPGSTMGYGMGASLGDFDSDGLLDIYVSNMYSKAGKRVIAGFDGDVDPRIKASSQGNFLFRKNENHFQQVAGLETEKQQVSKVGWSFGGQFADLNNDSKLDIYVPSGFFTAPDSIA